jgi:hypothetical protein
MAILNDSTTNHHEPTQTKIKCVEKVRGVGVVRGKFFVNILLL